MTSEEAIPGTKVRVVLDGEIAYNASGGEVGIAIYGWSTTIRVRLDDVLKVKTS